MILLHPCKFELKKHNAFEAFSSKAVCSRLFPDRLNVLYVRLCAFELTSYRTSFEAMVVVVWSCPLHDQQIAV
jgi:hypothetical protein